MLSVIKSKRFLTGLLLAICSFCIGILYNFAPLLKYDSEALEYLMMTTSNEILPVLLSSGVIICIATFICYFLGDIFKEKLELNTNKMDKKSWIYIGIVGICIPILIGFLDSMLKMGEDFVSFYYSVIDVSSSILYYGVIEEIWLRFAFLPLMIYTFYKVANRKTTNSDIDKKYYTIGLIFTTLFLFVFEFNGIAALYSLNLALVCRMILVYLIPNYIYGHLYLKYNLKVSILAHSIFIIMHLGVIPYVFTLL